MKILKLNIGSHITSDEYLSDEFIIGIKRDENSNIIIDKDCYRRLDDKKERVFTDEELLEKGFAKVELDDKYSDCTSADFNEDLTFSVEKYEARKHKEYAIPRIEELKKLLAGQDYQTIKYMQGELTEEKFNEVKKQCKEWRDEINALEDSL